MAAIGETGARAEGRTEAFSLQALFAVNLGLKQHFLQGGKEQDERSRGQYTCRGSQFSPLFLPYCLVMAYLTASHVLRGFLPGSTCTHIVQTFIHTRAWS